MDVLFCVVEGQCTICQSESILYQVTCHSVAGSVIFTVYKGEEII